MADRQHPPKHPPHPPHLHELDHPDATHVRGTFAGKIGFILAAAGSAVGLGNIWKFPYIVGENGGSAFILVYLVCILLVGVPVLLAEFVIGRAAQTSQVSAYRRLAPGKPWFLNGAMGLFCGWFILAFYCPVAGWVLAYGVKMALGMFQVDGMNPAQMGDYFEKQTGELITGSWEPLIWMLVILLLTCGIIAFGIEGGVERSCKILMPLLLFIMTLLAIRSLTLDGMSEGLVFLFKPDFAKLSPKAILTALSHCFFTLSLAMGAMMTYASYVKPHVDMSKMAVQVAALDTFIALFAGLIIFPAVFAFGMEPTAGPALIFQTLPTIFMQMPFGQLLGTAFFLLVTVAAITSTISLMEPIVTWMVDDLDWRRLRATVVTFLGIALLAAPVSLASGASAPLGEATTRFFEWFGLEGMTLFDFFDALTQKIMMPVGALVICLFIGFGWNRGKILQEAVGTLRRPGRVLVWWYWTCTILSPILILLVLLFGFGVFD